MDTVTRIVQRAQQSARPGHVGDAGSMYPAEASAGPAIAGLSPTYITWSGTTGTIHRRFLFNVASHGFGAEFV